MSDSRFFVGCDGDLVRESDCAVIRKGYCRTHAVIHSGRRGGAELRATLRAGSYTWPGGYPMYFVTSDGAALSFEAVRENLRSVLWSIRHKVSDGWRVIGCEVNWEDEELACDHTGKGIPSAYGLDLVSEGRK